MTMDMNIGLKETIPRICLRDIFKFVKYRKLLKSCIYASLEIGGA